MVTTASISAEEQQDPKMFVTDERFGAKLDCASPGDRHAISSSVVDTLSAQISVFEAGAARGLPALVLLPGLFCSAHSLLKSLMPLAAKTKLVAVEWRGHGKSVASNSFLVRDLAADVMAVIRFRLKGAQFCVLGHSMGARVLWAMLDSFIHELSPCLQGAAIIDQGPSPSTGKTSAGPADHEHALFRRDSQLLGLGKRQMLSTLRSTWGVADSGFMHSKSEIAQWLKFAAECNHVAGASLHWDALTSDYNHVVQAMNTKVLLMVGDATIAPSTLCKRMDAAIPPQGAHFALFSGGTHCLHHQAEHLPRLLNLVEKLINGSLERNVLPGGVRANTLQRFAAECTMCTLGGLSSLNEAQAGTQKEGVIRHKGLQYSGRPKSVVSANTGVRSILPLQASTYSRFPHCPISRHSRGGA